MWIDLLQVLVDRIVTGQYTPGELLPTEAQIGAEFGVSRSVVREAVKVLIEKGLARIDRGNGTLVADRRLWRSLDPLVLTARLRGPDRIDVLHELFVLRRSIEPELAAVAAGKASSEALVQLSVRMHDLVELMDQPNKYAVADLAFHQAIVEMAGVGLAQELFDTISEPLTVSRELTNQISGALENAHAHHLEIFDRIRDRDVAGARAAMSTHIHWAEDHLPPATPTATHTPGQN